MDFFFPEKNLLSFHSAKAQSWLSQKKPFLPSYTVPPQRGQVPTASRPFLFASGNRPAKRSSGAVCSFTSVRLISAICPIKDSAASSPRSTCFNMDSHSAVSVGDLILSGSTRIRFVPFSVGISCFFLRCTNPAETSFSSVAARVAGVPNPLRSASSGMSPAPAVSIAARRESSV